MNNQVAEAGAAAERIFTVLDDMPIEPIGREVGRDQPALVRHSRTVCFDEVGFAYPGQDRPAISDVNLEVPFGHTIAIVGGNGAGKTTLLRVMAGLLRPNRGAVTHEGTIGMVAHHTMMYDALTARENLIFFGRLHGVADEGLADRLIERLGLSHATHQRIGTFSRGMLQRLAIARSLLHAPQVLLFDEPLTGLDDAASRVVLEVIAELKAAGAALVIASHQLVELVGSVERVGYMVSGRLVAIEGIDGKDAGGVVSRYRELVANAG
jgi:heme exporter protein A